MTSSTTSSLVSRCVEPLPIQPRLKNRLVAVGCATLAGLFVANCGNQQTARSRSKEVGAFSHPKYGAASPRVVADGEDVPKGGGRDHVGKPYSVAGKRYVPYEKPVGFTAVGNASWYGEAFHGRRTANGEVYDRLSLTAAHPTMPLPSYARVTNTLNGRSIIVRVNDRGPFHGGRMIDVSQRTADALAFRHLGTARVRIDYVGRASLSGSDDRALLASLRTDGQPASMPGFSETTLVANAAAAPSPTATRAVEPVVPAAATAYSPVVRSTSSTSPASDAMTTLIQATAANTSPALSPVVTRSPLPPQRPFDLDTIPNAGALVSALPPGTGLRGSQTRNATVAKLFYAPNVEPAARLSATHPLTAQLTAQTFLPLRN
jgi:rare lipoprotein A